MAKIPVSYGTSDDNKVQITYDDGAVQILFPYDCPGGGGTEPEGTLYITDNGVYDVKQYAEADVNVTVTDYNFPNFIAEGRNNEGIYIFPDGTDKIGPHMFDGYTLFTNLSIPDSVYELSDGCFANCPNLDIPGGLFPNSLVYVGDAVFSGNTAMTELRFQQVPNHISETAFNGMTNLTDIHVPWAEGAVEGAPWCTDHEEGAVTVHYETE